MKTVIYNSCLYEEESLEELYNQIVENVEICIQENLVSDYEILFVDDGSTDASVLKMKLLSEKDKNVRYIVFRKNFGKSIALETAFRNVRGDTVITMDADLQDDPLEIKNFISKFICRLSVIVCILDSHARALGTTICPASSG